MILVLEENIKMTIRRLSQPESVKEIFFSELECVIVGKHSKETISSITH